MESVNEPSAGQAFDVGPGRRAHLGERNHRARHRELGVEVCAQRGDGRPGLFLGGSGYLLMELVADARPLLIGGRDAAQCGHFRVARQLPHRT